MNSYSTSEGTEACNSTVQLVVACGLGDHETKRDGGGYETRQIRCNPGACFINRDDMRGEVLVHVLRHPMEA
jgi:hypothetical protein